MPGVDQQWFSQDWEVGPWGAALPSHFSHQFQGSHPGASRPPLPGSQLPLLKLETLYDSNGQGDVVYSPLHPERYQMVRYIVGIQ